MGEVGDMELLRVPHETQRFDVRATSELGFGPSWGTPLGVWRDSHGDSRGGLGLAALLERWEREGAPLVAPAGNLNPGYQLTKRLLDIVGATCLLVLLAPVMCVVFCILLVTTRGKPLYSQVRVGWCGRRFRMYKFRTMVLNAEKQQHLVPNEQSGPVFKNRRDPRVTRIGRFLRSTSLDETPQLFHVLFGQMSLVGPRPPVPSEVRRYEPWQLARLAVKPGLTCLWQVSGRCEIGFHDWVRMDIWYLHHQSLLTDLMLLARTPLSVLSRRGAY